MSQKKAVSGSLSRLFLLLALPLFSSCLIIDGSFHERSILSFSFSKAANPGLRLPRTATIAEGSIAIELPDYLDLTSLAPDFTFEGLEVRVGGTLQESGVTKNDFTQPLTYSVLGKDDEWTDYQVKWTVVPASSAKGLEIPYLTFFLYNSTYRITDYRPDSTTWSTFIVDYDNEYDLAKAQTFVYSQGLDVSIAGSSIFFSRDDYHDWYYYYSAPPPSMPTPVDFSSPVDFLVTAEDGSTATYRKEIVSEPWLSSFEFSTTPNPGLRLARAGSIDRFNRRISIEIPDYIDPSAMVASFSTKGEGFAVGGLAQTSGVTPNDFRADLVYELKSRYGKYFPWTVHATVVPAYGAKSLVAITIGSISQSYSGFYFQTSTQDLVHAFPAVALDINLYHLYVLPSITGVAFEVSDKAGTRNLSLDQGKSTVHPDNYVDFTGPVTFTVRAEDGTSTTYTPSITKL